MHSNTNIIFSHNFNFFFPLIKIQADKIKEQQVYESLKSKYVGLGDSDTTRQFFLQNIKRDTYANIIQHQSMIEFISLSTNKPKNLVKNDLIKKMINP